MKRLVVLSGLLFGSVAMADDGDYKLFGCDATNTCVEIQAGNIEEFQIEAPCQFNCDHGDETGTKWGAKRKPAGPGDIISGATGMGKKIVGAGINGLKSAALGAGYTHFEATLSGPNGSISLKMNLQSSTWSVSGGGIGGGGPDPIKNIP